MFHEIDRRKGRGRRLEKVKIEGEKGRTHKFI